MIKRLVFSQQPLWSFVAAGMISGLLAALLVYQCYLEYQQSVDSIEHGLRKRGTAITRTLIAAIETNYERDQLTSESIQNLLDNTVTDTYEPYVAQVRTWKDVVIATAGSADLLKPGQSPAKNHYDEEMFVKTDTFRLNRQSVDPNRVQPQELAEGMYVLSVAIDASDARIAQSSAWRTFWIHSMWLAVLGVYMIASEHYRLRIRPTTQLQYKTLTQSAEPKAAETE